MRYLSVCSGIEAATVAWHPLGWRAAGFAEIDKFPSAVLAHHYPAVRNFGDFTTIEETDVGAIDLLVGGTPCQSFSVAGLRGGLGDHRGNLALEFCRLALRTRPRWLVWENVPGVLSSNGGRDFGSILGALAECGYGFAYRVLDAQYFGLAQRRKRVFVVGYLGDWRPAAAVLFERESLRGDPAPRRSTGQRVAGTLEARAGTGGYDPHLIAADLHPTLRAGGNRTGGHRPPGTDVDTMEGLIAFPQNLSGTQCATTADLAPSMGAKNPTAIAFDTTQITSASNYSNPKPGDPCHPLAAGAHPPAVAFESRYARNGRGAPDTIVPPLKAQSGETGKGDAAPLVAYSIMPQNSGKDFKAREVDGAQPLMTNPVGGNQGGDYVMQPAIAFKSGQSEAAGGAFVTEEYSPTLQAVNNGSTAVPSVMHAMAVRRLTPRECERLQGFPDDYTAVPYRGKPAADGPRYKALGNSMAVPVMRWLGTRIQMVDEMMKQEG